MMKFSFLFPQRHSQLGLTTPLLALLVPLVASATHLVGGELNLLHKSGSTYDFGGQDPDDDSLAFRPPNIITSNGNGLNESSLDQILPPNFRDQQFAGVRIFSRWGQQVHQSPDRTFHWPGVSVGGTYYYLATFTDGRRFKGWLKVLPCRVAVLDSKWPFHSNFS